MPQTLHTMLAPLPCQLAFGAIGTRIDFPLVSTAPAHDVGPRQAVNMNPVAEIKELESAARPTPIPLHVYVSEDLLNITYAAVTDDSKVFDASAGIALYTQIQERNLLRVPSFMLVTPKRYLDLILEPCVAEKLNAALSVGRRYTTYKGVTTSWDASVDKDVWTTNIDTVFLCQTLGALGVFDEPSYRKVLEVGVGGGHTSAAMAALMPSIEELSVTDISRYALQTAKLSIRSYLKRRTVDRYVHGAGIMGLDDDYDLIVCNPPYIPAPPSLRNDGDPYRGTGLIREILEHGTKKLNRKNPKAKILINISSLARNDLASYLKDLDGSVRFEKVHKPLPVPLKINSIDESWRRFLVNEGVIIHIPDTMPYVENYWHILQTYSIARK